jgi:hypothetical protein
MQNPKSEAQIVPLRIFARDDVIVRNLKAAKAELIQIEAAEEIDTRSSTQSWF